jgi:hypothetical protein
VVGTDRVRCDRFQTGTRSEWRTTIWIREVGGGKTDEQFLGGIIVDGGEALQAKLAGPIQSVGRERRPADDVGVDPKGLTQIIGEKGAGEDRVFQIGAATSLDAKLVEVV